MRGVGSKYPGTDRTNGIIPDGTLSYSNVVPVVPVTVVVHHVPVDLRKMDYTALYVYSREYIASYNNNSIFLLYSTWLRGL